jgi:iron complex outermembrane receptor protein
LNAAGLDTPAAIATRIPNVELDYATDGLRITMRGVSNADTTEKGDPSAAFLLDGIYIARPQAQNLSFYDLERVEVLRGPQGTLYGRNTTAGVVSVISKAPINRFEAWVAAEIGNYNSRKLSGMINLPVNDMLSLRAAVSANKHDSYLINGLNNGREAGQGPRRLVGAPVSQAENHARRHAGAALRPRQGGRQQRQLRPRHQFLHRRRQRQAGMVRQRHAHPADLQLRRAECRHRAAGAGAQLQEHLRHRRRPDAGPGPGHAVLPRLASQLRSRPAGQLLLPRAPALALNVRESFLGDYTQNSHELRVATNGDGPFSAQAGLYYFREESSQRYTFRDLDLIGLPPYYVFENGPTLSTSKAIFGQATYRVTDAAHHRRRRSTMTTSRASARPTSSRRPASIRPPTSSC